MYALDFSQRANAFRRLAGALDARVTVVVGAAGWGKTAAVRAWEPRVPRAWVSAESADAHGAEFDTRVLLALRSLRREPDERGSFTREYPDDEVVLVLDDLQEVPPCSEAAGRVEALCRSGPPGLHLVLVSRRELWFSVERLRGRGSAVEVGATEFALDLAEVAESLQAELGECPAALAEEVLRVTGGWPAAVRYLAAAVREAGIGRWRSTVEGSARPGTSLYRFVVEEVLGYESDAAVAFLRRAAVLGEVWQALGQVAGADELLGDLVRRGLIVRDDHGRGGWALPRPVREAVLGRFPAPPGEQIELHRRAAGDCSEQGAHAAALRHLLAAGDHAGCASLLREHGASLVNTGHIETVLAAAEMPRGYLADPGVQQLLGHARLIWGQWAGALECFRRAAGAGDDSELPPGITWRIGMVSYLRGEFPETLTLCARMSDDGTAPGDAARVLALAADASRQMGDLPAAHASAQRATGLSRRCDDRGAEAAVLATLSLLADADADRLRADSFLTRAREAAEQAADVLQLLRLRVLRAFHLTELGLGQEALDALQAALCPVNDGAEPWLRGLVLSSRGTVKLRMGEPSEALGDFACARDLLDDLGSRFVAWALCGLGDVYSTWRQLSRARGYYEEALEVAGPCHDVLALSSTLSGLARVRAVDDLAAARELAERAVGLEVGQRCVQALLSRGWVALLAEDRQQALRDASGAAAAARTRRDGPGLAEALTLTTLASDAADPEVSMLAEAVQSWQDNGRSLDAAQGQLVLAGLGGPAAEASTGQARHTLRAAGVNLEAPPAAGPLAVLAMRLPRVAMHTLGVFRVRCGDKPIPATAWQSRKARDLLKILVARRQPVPRDQLIELLWPDTSPARSRNRLSALLSVTRDVLQSWAHTESPLLCADSDAVWLDYSKVQVDAEEFLSMASAALVAHRAGGQDALDRLAAAAARLTGAFLEDEPYAEWAEDFRDEVRAVQIALLRALAQQHSTRGELDAATSYTLRLLAQDRYDEAAHLQLVRTQLRAGHLGEARRRYEIYVRRMNDLDVAPSPFPSRNSPHREHRNGRSGH